MDGAPDTQDSQHAPWMVRMVTAVTGPWSRDNLFGLLRLLAVILFIKGCVVDQYAIPSESMEPTLHGDERFMRGDRVLVNKWQYGPRIPLTSLRLWTWGAPERWDIVVFRPIAGSSDHHTLIKRVVGLPGERVRITQGGVEVNGEMLELPAGLPPNLHYYNDAEILQKSLLAATPQEQQLWETIRRQYPLRYGILEDDQYQLVPEGQYFLLGDNSLHSIDGRVFGWVPAENIVGRAFAIWWPWPRRRDFSGFSGTWWGMLLLYGLPVALACYEFLRYRRQRRASGTPAL